MHDVIIIGGGPAGMTAAVYAVRKKMDTLLITKDFGGQLMWTREIENYMGFQVVTGPELINKFEEQVKKFPVNVKYEEVTQLSAADAGNYLVRTRENQYVGKSVIVASGKRSRQLNVPGELEFAGRGVAYCATCDGPLYAGKTVAVVGGGNSGAQAALELSEIAVKVYLVIRGEFRADPVLIDKLNTKENVSVLKGHSVQGIYGGQMVEKIVVIDESQSKELMVQGVFVEIGLDPNSEFANGTTKLNQYDEIVTDCRAKTSQLGLFAAGDVTNGPDKQIIIAAGDGAKAALSAYEYLLHKS
jgi:alkyl hydroperoxide reductase subunit F